VETFIIKVRKENENNLQHFCMCNSSGNVVKEQKQMLAHSRGSLSSLMYSGFHSWIAVLWKDFHERKLKFNI